MGKAEAMCGGGGIGGILGGLAGGALDIFGFPEAGIPLALATGAGTAIGSTIGGAASGEGVGKAALGGLEGGVLSGGLAGLGELGATGDFLGTPTTSTAGGLFGGGTGAAAATGTGTGSGLSGATGTQLASAGASDAAGGGAAPAVGGLGSATSLGAGGGAGAPISGVASTSGATPGSVSGALSSSPGTLSQDLGGVSPNVGGSTDSLASTVLNAPTTSGGIDAVDTGTTPLTQAQADSTGQGIGGKILGFAEKNPSLLLAGGGLAASLLGNNTVPGLSSLQSEAALLAGQGNEEATALQTGQLPSGAQAQLDQATSAAKATVRSNFAALGDSGSTSEAQALSGIDQQAAAQKFQDIQGVTQTGLNEVGAANTLYGQIMNAEVQQDQQTQNAISRLATALAGGGLKAAA